METMDFGLIAEEGIECFVKGLEGQPIRLYYLFLLCVPHS